MSADVFSVKDLQEISNLIGILAAPFVATSTNTAANKRLKELMGP